jgi:hypothetical protein
VPGLVTRVLSEVIKGYLAAGIFTTGLVVKPVVAKSGEAIDE